MSISSRQNAGAVMIEVLVLKVLRELEHKVARVPCLIRFAEAWHFPHSLGNFTHAKFYSFYTSRIS